MSGSPTVFKRMELKYRLSAGRFRPFLAALREYAEPDAYGQYTIGSLYYDTPAYDLIRASLEKPVYKEKLRLRGYGIPKASDTVYLELKKKYKGEVFKRRVPLPLETAARYMRTGEKPHPSCQVLEEIDWFTRCRPLQPAAYLAYDRTALFDRADPGVRITFDERIRYRARPSRSVLRRRGRSPVPRRHRRHGNQAAGLHAPVALPPARFVCALSCIGLQIRHLLPGTPVPGIHQGRKDPFMFDTFAGSILQSGLTPVLFLICTAVSLLLGLGTALIYMHRSHYSKSFVITLALLPAMVQLVIMLVNGNLGTGVAVAGAFSLIRFRSVPGSAKEIGCIFFAMAIGLATGMGYLLFGFLFFLVVGAALLLNATRFGESRQGDSLLRIVIPESLDYEGLFDDLFDQYTQAAELIRVKTTNMGSLYELTYQVRLKSPAAQKAFLDELRCRNGNLTISCGRLASDREEL